MTVTKKLRMAAWLLLAVCLLTACRAGAPALKYENGAYRDAASERAFRRAPECYRAASCLTETVYATIPSGKAEKPLYAIEGMDPTLWLTDENYTVYYSESITLPKLSELSVSRITLAIEYEAATVAHSFVEKPEQINALIALCEGDVTVPKSKVIPTADNIYKMLFASSTYPGLLYSLECWSFEKDVELFYPLAEDGSVPALFAGVAGSVRNGEAVYNVGKYLIFDRYAGKFYVPADLIDGFFTEQSGGVDGNA